MAKGKKRSSEPKGRKITLKMAKLALNLTVDGKRWLVLSNMEISTFPKCILKLCDVDELDLSRNLLKKIPDSIDKFVNLRWLDLHSNQLDQVPEAIGRLQNLYSLNLCNNCLSTVGLPNEIVLLRKLRCLNLGMNVPETIPSSIAALKELRHLGLFSNHLTQVPECLCNLPHLETVNLKCNPMPLEDDKGIEPIQRVECLYLVRESCLCASCLQKVKDDRQRMDSRLRRGPAHRKSIFAGLNTPNSVVQEDQATWR
ncbi:leucine-rich repeat-containing protein 18-like [Coregonus clupeaformis]|uniref:leucine-rich repeat-containing protein 18-like n=1 Tax=Coregonus clupeaformis TaxID=59861 RepID=UPI001BE00388|nr:leucine-rich repeat-containing protein 18-like [Coregonus clupeaformis]